MEVTPETHEHASGDPEHNNGPNQEQNTTDNRRLPGMVVREEANGREKNEGKEASGQTTLASDTKKKPHITMLGRIERAWKKTTVANKLIAAFTGITAIATFGYACLVWGQLSIMGRQLGIMDEQLREMRASAHLEQRAWVFCEGVKCRHPIATGGQVNIDLTYTNSGKTPANKVRINCDIVIEAKNYAVESYVRTGKTTFPTEVDIERFIAPNTTRNAPHDFTLPFTDEVVAQIRSGAFVVYVFGDITYDDVFGERHQTLYAYTVDPSTWQLKAYYQHNRME
jgi:hypothetical protein